MKHFVISAAVLFAVVGFAFADEVSLDHGIHVYYFYSKPRCKTCRDIEAFTHEAVKRTYPDQPISGLLRWEPSDTAKPETKHLTKHFDPYTTAVVLVEKKDGQTLRWKNLDQIWRLVHNREAFEKYIVSEVNQYVGDVDG